MDGSQESKIAKAFAESGDKPKVISSIENHINYELDSKHFVEALASSLKRIQSELDAGRITQNQATSLELHFNAVARKAAHELLGRLDDADAKLREKLSTDK